MLSTDWLLDLCQLLAPEEVRLTLRCDGEAAAFGCLLQGSSWKVFEPHP